MRLVAFQTRYEMDTRPIIRGVDTHHDYEVIVKMIEDDPQGDTLFIFADNVMDHESACPDGAILRPYNRHGMYFSKPRSSGIPVLWDSWEPLDYFEEFDQPVKRHIDLGFKEIRELIVQHRYESILFFVQKDTGLFDSDVLLRIREYITKGLYSLGRREIDSS